MGLEAVLGWLGTFFDVIISLFPHLLVIEQGECYIKHKRGKHPVILNPGLHWYWPIISNAEAVDLKWRVIETTAQALTTADGVAWQGGAFVRLQVVKPLVWALENEDPEADIAVEAAGACAQIIERHSAEDLHSLTYERKAQIMTEVMRKLAPSYGCRIKRSGLISSSRTRHLTLET